MNKPTTKPDLSALSLTAPHLRDVQAILRRHVPHAEVWAYGSRVTGDGHEASDLDLVLRHPADLDVACPELFALKALFLESNLPIRVDVLDWSCIPADFRKEIERAYVVLQAADPA
jgi:predicted nucleotidyltransferase